MQVYEMAHTLNLRVQEVYDMDFDEWQGWLEYFQRRPVGWRADLRSAYQMNAQGVKKKPEEIFPSIANVKRDESHVKNRRIDKGGRSDARDLQRSGFFNLLRTNTGFNPTFENIEEE